MVNLFGKKAGIGNLPAAPAATYDYDLIVICGGSGGMAAAKEAAHLGARVQLFDFVDPTNHGTTWGLGGTCVNVGCIPKKLMHKAGRLGSSLHRDMKAYGWESQGQSFTWTELVKTVQSYIKQLNFSYRVSLRSAKVEYVNAKAAFAGPHSVEYKPRGSESMIQSSAKFILIAVGGRPTVPSEADVPGASQYAITSDDLFSLPKHPGKTLVVGASYIALECAGFLTELGFDTTVAVRSIVLRGFDRQCSEKVANVLKELGTKFVNSSVRSISKDPKDGKLLVSFTVESKSDEKFDTVLYATGRYAVTGSLNLAKANLSVVGLKGKLECSPNDCCVSSSHIYAVGDVQYGKPELTPVAVKAGTLLARRLFGTSSVLMDYTNVPTTVFTPVEYGCVGLSEEDAILKYGQENVEIYLFEFNPIEVSAAHWEKADRLKVDEFDSEMSPICLSKLVVLPNDDNRIVGYHSIGHNAGEATQGFAVAIKAGATKDDFDDCVGIHPTDAESFCNLTITRRSGANWIATGGCGGGTCG